MQQQTPKKHLATISILIKDRQSQAADINQILADHGHMIMARLGLNLHPKCLEHCTAIITVTVEGEIHEIRTLEKKLDDIYGIVAKASILTE